MTWALLGLVGLWEELRLRKAELGRRFAHLAREGVWLEALRERASRDREGDVMHLDPRLHEPRHGAAAAELAVVGVRRKHQHAVPALDQAPSSRRRASVRATSPSRPHVIGSSKSAL